MTDEEFEDLMQESSLGADHVVGVDGPPVPPEIQARFDAHLAEVAKLPADPYAKVDPEQARLLVQWIRQQARSLDSSARAYGQVADKLDPDLPPNPRRRGFWNRKDWYCSCSQRDGATTLPKYRTSHYDGCPWRPA